MTEMNSELNRIHDRLDRMAKDLQVLRDRSQFAEGFMLGTREAVMNKLDRIEKLLVEHHGYNAPSLTLSGTAEDVDATS
jgi:hypothetical protein